MIAADRARSSLQLLFAGDALSMPVHWFYRPGDIWRAFPPDGINDYQPAPETHPSSIMSLHSKAGGGRTRVQPASAREVVGDVILKGRAHLWDKPSVHYHHGMPAGENTLNAWCARWLIQWLARSKLADDGHRYDVGEWLNHYVECMTADPPRHPDTYAESYHRGFFANRLAGQPIQQCGAVTHDTPSMGALVTVAPLALALLKPLPLSDVQSICRAHVSATHPDDQLMNVVDAYVRLMDKLLHRETVDNETIQQWFVEAAMAVPGGDIAEAVRRTAIDKSDKTILQYVSEDRAIVGERYSLACYITDSWPSVCYLAARHFRNPRRALLVNTNAGGENAHRGSVLGTLVGLASVRPVDELCEGLARRAEIEHDIQVWLRCFYR